MKLILASKFPAKNTPLICFQRENLAHFAKTPLRFVNKFEVPYTTGLASASQDPVVSYPNEAKFTRTYEKDQV